MRHSLAHRLDTFADTIQIFTAMEKSTEIKNSELLRMLIYKGARDKKLVLSNTVVSSRIAYELSIIERQGFTDHFILYSRIAEVCNELRLICSPGRGNSINSLVNYCLDITRVNPVTENLWFESFIYRDQKHFPDIDIDVPFGSRKTVIETLKQEHPEFNIYPIAISINSNIAIHPCGVIITHKKLDNSTFLHKEQELYYSPDIHNEPIYKNNKVDILELSYLNRLQLIVNEIGEEYHPYKLPLNDEQVFNFFASGDLENIFQFDSPKLTEYLADVKPNSIYKLSSVYFKLMQRPATSISFSHSLSFTILSYWGCYYKTHFRKEFEMVFSKQLTEY